MDGAHTVALLLAQIVNGPAHLVGICGQVVSCTGQTVLTAEQSVAESGQIVG